jgi:fructose-1,6-bisphosphatase/inositol monophosphatase family enzyme
MLTVAHCCLCVHAYPQGTTNFVHGFPFTCVSIGFARAGSVEIGIIYDPVKDEMFQAVKGHGVWLNGKRQHASDATAMAHSLIITYVLVLCCVYVTVIDCCNVLLSPVCS